MFLKVPAAFAFAWLATASSLLFPSRRNAFHLRRFDVVKSSAAPHEHECDGGAAQDSQIDELRRKNRPSTVPATINLIVKSLETIPDQLKASAAPIDKLEYVSSLVAEHLADLAKSNQNDVDSEYIGFDRGEEW